MVASSEQMDHQNPIDLLKELSDPSLSDPDSKDKNPQLPQGKWHQHPDQSKMDQLNGSG